MRRSLPACRGGPALAAAVVLLTACGGSDDEESAAATSTTAERSTSDFCSEAASVQQRITDSAGEPGEDTSLRETFEAAADEVRDIAAPEEIAADWNALADGLDQFAAVIDQADPDDPEALGGVQEQFDQIQAQLGAASANVQNYLTEECGLGSSGSAAPTS